MDSKVYKYRFNQWSFDYYMSPGSGLVLENVMNMGHRFAASVRVNRIWIDPGTENARSLFLGTEDFNILEAGPEYKLVTHKQPPLGFSGYPTRLGLEVLFESKEPLYPPLEAKLRVRQTYLFSSYGHEPSHEASDLLDACRIFPMIEFEIPGTEHPLESIRFDFRIDPALDFYLEKPSNYANFGQDDSWARRNQAGVFRDNETALNIDGFLSSLIYQIDDVVFAAGEKPLLYEIATHGLVEGVPAFTEEIGGKLYPDEETWDNTHIWGCSDTSTLPSTPGAFHAAHFHWRWGKLFELEPSFPLAPILPHTGQPQYIGEYINNRIGGPLLHPDIPNQTIRFAVTRNDRPEWRHDSLASEEFFFDLFWPKNGGIPSDIQRGDEIVYWYSVEVKRKKYLNPYRNEMAGRNYSRKEFKGTINIQGFFFAHNPEPEPIDYATGVVWDYITDPDFTLAHAAPAATVGEELYSPFGKPEQVWDRGAYFKGKNILKD